MTRPAKTKTNWLGLLGDDRANLGRSVVRLAHLAAAQHRAASAQQLHPSPANGLAQHDTDRLINVAQSGDVSWDMEVPR